MKNNSSIKQITLFEYHKENKKNMKKVVIKVEHIVPSEIYEFYIIFL